MGLSFIHCADLHLGTVFKSIPDTFSTDDEILQKILYSPEKAFKYIIDFAIERKVDFVLFAGDIMDSTAVNYRTLGVLQANFKRLKQAGIPAFVIAGNHDKLPNTMLEKACQDAVLFCHKEVEYHEIPGKAVISGISFSAENAGVNLAKKYHRQDSNLFQIALYHANIGGQNGYDNYSPASLTDLVEANFDYWALGHIHEKKMLSEANPVILYSGSTVSRHVNERSPKGFYLVDVDDFKHVKTEFVPIDTVGFFRMECDLGNVSDQQEMRRKVREIIKESLQEHTLEMAFVELILCGATSLDAELRRQNEDDLRFFLEDHSADAWRITAVDIKTTNMADNEFFCRENIFGGDLKQAFNAEIAAGCPEINSELAALKRTYGNLFADEDVSCHELTAEAEKELLRLLSEDDR